MQVMVFMWMETVQQHSLFPRALRCIQIWNSNTFLFKKNIYVNYCGITFSGKPNFHFHTNFTKSSHHILPTEHIHIWLVYEHDYNSIQEVLLNVLMRQDSYSVRVSVSPPSGICQIFTLALSQPANKQQVLIPYWNQ